MLCTPQCLTSSEFLEEPDLEEEDGGDVPEHDKGANGEQEIRDLHSGVDGCTVDGEYRVEDDRGKQNGHLAKWQAQNRWSHISLQGFDPVSNGLIWM